MANGKLTSEVIDQLRGAWRAAGIAATDADLEGIVARGFLDRLIAFRELLNNGSPDTVPDYLNAGLTAAPPLSEEFSLPVQAPQDTLLAVAPLLQRGELSPCELVEQALARIAAHDSQLHAFQLVLADQVREAARQAEAEITAGYYRGPLHGVPVAVKDLFDLAGTPTSAGSTIRAGRPVSVSSTVVEQLEHAGALIVGKTRMSEFAYSPGSNNAHYGPTPNPWNPTHDSGGSSSGSAVAVAAGMVYAAIGSDTGGSIRIPAANCGIVGLKPTYGLVSLAGAVSLSWSLDHGGPLARSVADAATILASLSGPDSRDPRVPAEEPMPAGNLAAGVNKLRVGLLDNDGTGGLAVSDEVRAALQRTADGLMAAGATVIPLAMPAMDGLRLLNGAILAMEAAAFHLPTLCNHLDELGPFLRQRLLAAFAYGPGDFVRAQQRRRELRARCMGLFTQVDIICAPCVPDTAPLLETPTTTNFTGPFNCLGWPALSLPAGLSGAGLPLGVQLIARPRDEFNLLRAAYAAEQQLGRLVPMSAYES